MRRLICFMGVLCLFHMSTEAQVRKSAQIIKEKMNALTAMIGTWEAKTTFYDRTTHAPGYEETGTYKISRVLDSTYLQWDIRLHDKMNRGYHRSMFLFITYNPDSARYEGTYFYNGSALKVSQYGKYDETAHAYIVTAFIPLEDGEHDESVRSITKMDAKDEITYTHYSRYSNEKAECNDFSAILKRIK